MYRDQNSPGGVVERETGEVEVADGGDCGQVKDVTIAVGVREEGRKEGRGEERRRGM